MMEKWIEANKALPRSGERVLVYGIKLHKVTIAWYSEFKEWHSFDVGHNDKMWMLNDFITHWKKLPTRPNVKCPHDTIFVSNNKDVVLCQDCGKHFKKK